MKTENINALRAKRGLTVEDLAGMSGIPIGTLAKITSQATKNPKFDTVDNIARVLGCSLDVFSEFRGPDTLTPEEVRQLKLYRLLDGHGKSMVDMVLKSEYDRCTESPDF